MTERAAMSPNAVMFPAFATSTTYFPCVFANFSTKHAFD